LGGSATAGTASSADACCDKAAAAAAADDDDDEAEADAPSMPSEWLKEPSLLDGALFLLLFLLAASASSSTDAMFTCGRRDRPLKRLRHAIEQKRPLP
jgi:hypothetical protein